MEKEVLLFDANNLWKHGPSQNAYAWTTYGLGT